VKLPDYFLATLRIFAILRSETTRKECKNSTFQPVVSTLKDVAIGVEQEIQLRLTRSFSFLPREASL
jgi:hypothetical protein